MEADGRERSYAGLVPRIAAYFVDCVLLSVLVIPWEAALYVVNPIVSIMRSGHQPSGGQIHLWVFATVTIPSLLYFTLMLRSSRQATLGMRLLKLKAADANGGRIGFGKALLRSAVLLIPFELNHTVIFHLLPRGGPPSTPFFLGLIGVWAVIAIYVASVILTPLRQSVHDLVAHTIVERVD